jgi:hypothetical protein
MSTDTFREQARMLLQQMMHETPKADPDQVLDAYADALAQVHASESHKLLNEVIADARTRLDARLSPDPVRQTIATVQTTVQDFWRALWQG